MKQVKIDKAMKLNQKILQLMEPYYPDENVRRLILHLKECQICVLKNRQEPPMPFDRMGRNHLAGIGLQFGIEAPYRTLYNLFGKPLGVNPDGKVKAEWIIKFVDGSVANIWDYKSPVAPQKNKHWSVGGDEQGKKNLARWLILKKGVKMPAPIINEMIEDGYVRRGRW